MNSQRTGFLKPAGMTSYEDRLLAARVEATAVRVEEYRERILTALDIGARAPMEESIAQLVAEVSLMERQSERLMTAIEESKAG